MSDWAVRQHGEDEDVGGETADRRRHANLAVH
jgi:hypothetical protein